MTPTYDLKIYYDETSPCQFYVIFLFNGLKGVMRLCPTTKMHMSLVQFEKECDLAPCTRPGPKQKAWMQRWLGMDNGMRGHLFFGGEMGTQSEFTFTEDASCSTEDFQGMNIEFDFLYSCTFHFNGHKAENLDPIKMPSLMKHSRLWTGPRNEWDEICYPKWHLPQFKSSISLSNSESDSDDEPSMPTPVKRLQVEQPEPKPAKRQKREQPKPKSAPCIEACPSAAWDVTGEYKVDFHHLARLVGLEIEESDLSTITIHMSNNPRHTAVGRQLWAVFKFGDSIKGCMRFCPRPPRMSDSNAKFERDCILGQGQWPGPNQLKWSLRWRGKRIDDFRHYMDGSDEHETEIEFEKGGAGQLALKGVIMCDFQPTILNAVKTADVAPLKATAGTVTAHWKDYKPSTSSRCHVIVKR